jgi:hypothetical protein
MDVLGEGLADRLRTIGRLCDDAKIGLGIDHGTQAGANDRVIVCDQDAGHGWDGHGFAMERRASVGALAGSSWEAQSVPRTPRQAPFVGSRALKGRQATSCHRREWHCGHGRGGPTDTV